MRRLLTTVLIILTAFSLQSCNGFRGLAGPSYVKLYNNFANKKELQIALNAFYQRHPKTIIKYEEWVKRGFTESVSLRDPDSISVFEKDYFHRVIHYDNYSDEWWNIKDPNGTYLFTLDVSNCDENQQVCDLCLKSVNGKNWELKPKERFAALKVFQAEILPKLEKLIEENNRNN